MEGNVSPETIQQIFALVDLLSSYHLGYLAAAIAVITLLGTAFYFFNIRPTQDLLLEQKKELSKLQDDAKISAANTVKELEKKFQESSATLKVESLALFEGKAKVFENIFGNKLEELRNELVTNIEVTSSTKDNFLKASLEDSIKNKVDALKNELVGTFNERNNKHDDTIKDLDIRLRVLESFRYRSEGKMGAILIPLQILKEIIGTSREWECKYVLDDLAEGIGDDGSYHDAKLLDEIKDVLSKINQDDCKVLKQKILDALLPKASESPKG